MKIDTNKKSYFYIDVKIPEEHKNSQIHYQKITNAIDLILDAMKVADDTYRFENHDSGRIIQFFKTESRKRKGQLNKFCERFIEDNEIETVRTGGVNKDWYETEILKLTKNKNYSLTEEPKKDVYNGEDIKLFEDRKNWKKWQKKLYDKIFETSGEFKKPDQRKIVSLIDYKGCSGKSTFFKFLFVNHPSEIGRIGYGTANQLRSSVTNLGVKKLFIIDLTRAKGKEDNLEDLLSITEDVKNGLVINPMFGSGRILIM
jgi:hypothetical protein